MKSTAVKGACDFLNFTRMDPALLPGYRTLCDRFAHLAKVTLSNHARRAVKFSCTGIAQTTLGSIADRYPDETFITLFSMVEREGPALVVLDQAPAYALLAALLGGKPQATPPKGTTASEIEVLGVVMRALFEDLTQAGAQYGEIAARWTRAECRFEFVAVVPQSEPMLVATFRIDVGGVSGEMHLVAPSRTVFPLRDALIV